MKTHHAVVEEATESDTDTWVYITCEPKDGFQNKVPYTKFWDKVDCKNCLRRKPSKIDCCCAAPESFGKEHCADCHGRVKGKTK